MNIPLPTDWLLQGPAWVRWRTRLDLLDAAPGSEQAAADRQEALGEVRLAALVNELQDWPCVVLNGHKSAGHPIHKLTFLTDLGVTLADPGMAVVAERILSHRDADGVFQVLMNIPAHFGGSGKDEMAWALCDAPLLVAALARLGLGGDERVMQAASRLGRLARPNGWPCASGNLGRFRGPGRKEDPCPYATLVMLKAAAELPELMEPGAAQAGTEAILGQWAGRRESHPYMFYMGTDFCKLKAPLVWYDLLHVLDVLTRFAWLSGDARLKDMLDLLESKADPEGRFTPESAWTAWKDWDFGQKKGPSAGLTLLAWRVLKRAGRLHSV
ncbi:MAG TPA: hypothetical protein PKW33_02795 [Anaerolineaceae bacterium]|nr:hypothetical protein [Anaerolineaceae bacterium]HPN50489.1 hypothetical protein [Anaerolineaceae bacterium]